MTQYFESGLQNYRFSYSLRSWRYCVGARLKFLAAEPCSKKGSRDEAVDEAVFLAASPLVTAPPSNLTRIYYNGSAAKSHSTTTQYRQLRRLLFLRSRHDCIVLHGNCKHRNWKIINQSGGYTNKPFQHPAPESTCSETRWWLGWYWKQITVFVSFSTGSRPEIRGRGRGRSPNQSFFGHLDLSLD